MISKSIKDFLKLKNDACASFYRFLPIYSSCHFVNMSFWFRVPLTKQLKRDIAGHGNDNKQCGHYFGKIFIKIFMFIFSAIFVSFPKIWFEPLHKKTNKMLEQKQRRRSASW